MNQQEFNKIQNQIKTSFEGLNDAFKGMSKIMDSVKQEMTPEQMDKVEKAVSEFEGVNKDVIDLKKRFESYGNFH